MTALSVRAIPPRVERWRQAARSANVDAIVALHSENVFHAFCIIDTIIASTPAVVIIPHDADATAFVHVLRTDRAKERSFLTNIRGYGVFFGKPSFAKSWHTAVLAVLEEKGITEGKIGIEYANITVGHAELLHKHLPKVKFVDVSSQTTNLRLVEDPDEVASARIAGEFADAGMEAALKRLASCAITPVTEQQPLTVTGLVTDSYIGPSKRPMIATDTAPLMSDGTNHATNSNPMARRA